MNIDFSKFPSTRYQGSKRKILSWLYDNFKELSFQSVLDAFGGTASVSYLFKKMGKDVTYNDILKFNYIIGKSIIENQSILLTEQDIINICDHTSSQSSSFIQNNFIDVYYLDHENKWLDSIIDGIITMNHYSIETIEYKRALLYYALFQSCLVKRPFNLFHRKNLNLRTSNVERSFGNKKTWDTPFDVCFKNFSKEANKLVFNSRKKCLSINKSVFDINDDKYDLVYLDPPYFKRDSTNETSNYKRCYHFLEGIANYQEWEALIDLDTPNNRFKDCDSLVHSDKEIRIYFENLISKFASSSIALSYKQGGIPSVGYLEKLIKKVKGNVYKKSISYNYALNTHNNTKINREVLLVGL